MDGKLEGQGVEGKPSKEAKEENQRWKEVQEHKLSQMTGE